MAVSTKTTYEGYAMVLACLKNAYSYVNVCDAISSPDFKTIATSLRPGILVTDALTYGQFPFLANIAAT
jgi:hypothetical protein